MLFSKKQCLTLVKRRWGNEASYLVTMQNRMWIKNQFADLLFKFLQTSSVIAKKYQLEKTLVAHKISSNFDLYFSFIVQSDILSEKLNFN